MRIEKEECEALIIDVQEKLFPHMAHKDALKKNLEILIHGLKALRVPFIITQQYTKGLGDTIASIRTALERGTALECGTAFPGDPVLDTDAPGLRYIEKISFSCCDEPAFETRLRDSGKKSFIVAGIEAHVCVLQTVLDILRWGLVPILVEDCTASRNANNKNVAVERMRAEGAIITTYESLLFELCRYAGNDTFRAISRLVK